MSLVRIKISELEARAATRKPGYIEAVKAAAQPDQGELHLLIDSQKLNDILSRYADLTDRGHGCCGGW
jgi:hypothetical protein